MARADSRSLIPSPTASRCECSWRAVVDAPPDAGTHEELQYPRYSTATAHREAKPAPAGPRRRAGFPNTTMPSHPGRPGADPPRQGEADRSWSRTQPLRSLNGTAGQARYLLDAGTSLALGVPTGGPTDPQPEDNASPGAGHISGEEQVGAVNPAGPDATPRANGARRGALRGTAHFRDARVHRRPRVGSRVREPPSRVHTDRPAPGMRAVGQDGGWRTVSMM